MKQAQVIVSVITLICCSVLGHAQQTVATDTNVVVPPLVNFSGTLTDTNGRPLSGAVAVTFSLYSEQMGGAALWTETQNVEPDRTGHYTVMLGSTSSSGLPSDIFVAGQAHWLGVHTEAEAEQPRVLLVSAPYALKAGDAETIGGLPPSAFVLAAPPSDAAVATVTAADTASLASGASAAGPLTSSDVTTTGGTVNAIPLFSTATNIQNSLLTQTSTTAVNVGGKLNLTALGTATSSAGFNSRPQDFIASAYDSTTSAAVNQTFQWQAQPAGNDTASPSATLNLLYASGTNTPTQTGLDIASNGHITFATGQTFPGTGTITGVTTASGSGLSGGGGSGTLNLALTSACAANQVLQWNGTVWKCSSAGTGTITGVTAGTGLTGGGTAGKVTLNLDTTKVPLLTAANTFTGQQTINNSTIMTGTNVNGVLQVTNTNTSGFGPAIFGTTDSPGAYGITGVVAATTGTTAGVRGETSSNGGYGVIGTSPNAGVYGTASGTSSTGTKFGSLSGILGDTGGASGGAFSGVMGTADDNNAGFFLNNTGNDVTTATLLVQNSSENEGSLVFFAFGDGAIARSTVAAAWYVREQSVAWCQPTAAHGKFPSTPCSLPKTGLKISVRAR